MLDIPRPTDRLSAETVTLEAMEYALARLITKELVDDFANEPKIDLARYMGGDIVVQVKQTIFGEQVLHETVKYPSDWKEAFKERWFPKWAKRKWPVRYERVEFDARFLYPSIKSNYESHLVTRLERDSFLDID